MTTIASRKIYNKHGEFFGHATIYEASYWGQPHRYVMIHDLGSPRGDEVSDAAVHAFEREYGIGTEFPKARFTNSFD